MHTLYFCYSYSSIGHANRLTRVLMLFSLNLTKGPCGTVYLCSVDERLPYRCRGYKVHLLYFHPINPKSSQVILIFVIKRDKATVCQPIAKKYILWQIGISAFGLKRDGRLMEI